jgi:hypothetical protein
VPKQIHPSLHRCRLRQLHFLRIVLGKLQKMNLDRFLKGSARATIFEAKSVVAVDMGSDAA